MLSGHVLRAAGGVMAAVCAALLPWTLTHLPHGTPATTRPPAVSSPAPAFPVPVPTVTVTRVITRTVRVHQRGRPPAVVAYLHQEHHQGREPRSGGTGPAPQPAPSHPGGHGSPQPHPSPPPPGPSPTPRPTPTPTRKACAVDVHLLVRACIPPVTALLGGTNG
jgi:hypothetical protein